MKCGKCGKEVNEGASFCNNCGASLNSYQTNTNENMNKYEHYTQPNKNKTPKIIIGIVIIIAIIVGGFLLFGKDILNRGNDTKIENVNKSADAQIENNNSNSNENSNSSAPVKSGDYTERSDYNENSEQVKIIAKSYFKKYPFDEKYLNIGSAFESYFDNTTWEYFKSEDNEDIVEFNGTFTKDGEKIDSCIQFELFNDNTFEICYVGLNGKSQDQRETDNLIRDIMVNTKTKSTN